MKYWKALVWTAIIFVLSLMSSDNIPKNTFFDKIYADKWVHAFIYFIQCFFIIAINKNNARISVYNKYIPAIIIGILTGIITELAQKFLTLNRSAEIGDFLANISGILLACLLYDRVYKFLQKTKLDFIV